MAALPHPPMVSVAEYLATTCPEGDREYVDGVVVERNVGSPARSALQKILSVHLAAFERQLGRGSVPSAAPASQRLAIACRMWS